MAWTTPRTWVTGELMNTHIRDNLLGILPVGSFLLRAAPYTTVETAVESRWLQCNGVAVSRTTYSVLFNYLNSLSPALPFGVGDGVTTFTLPSAAGRVMVAEGEHAEVDSMGESEGAAVASRSIYHHHRAQFGSTSVGGSVPAVQILDSAVTFTYPTTGGNTQDTPAFLVAGSWFIKYTS
jgi:microcystin-dependent protein